MSDVNMGNLFLRRPGTPSHGLIYFGETNAAYLNWDGGSFVFSGGPLYLTGGINAAGVRARYAGFTPSNIDAASLICEGSYGGGITLQDGGNRASIWAQSGDLCLGNGSGASPVRLTLANNGNSTIHNNLYVAGALHVDNNWSHCKGYVTKQGTDNAYEGNIANFSWWNNYFYGWIGTTAVGMMNPAPSDYRIKKDVIDLPGMWDTVKALRPIKYTHANFSPPSHVAHVEDELAKRAATPEQYSGEVPPPPVHLFVEDSIERWGFIAHELQDTLTPSASSGVKDSENEIQTPNPFTVIAALTKALQEAMIRIEALEGTR
jgi:hypothetical protein